MSQLTPPRIELTWSATALTTAFSKYRVYRRPARVPVAAWALVAEITVPDGYTASTVEAQHTAFTDLEAGWSVAGGKWADGWDYYVSVVNGLTGLESDAGGIDTRNTVTPDDDSWLASNEAPWVTHSVFARDLAGEDLDDFRVYRLARRDYAVTRTSPQIPTRQFHLAWNPLPTLGEDVARYGRAAARGGRRCALLLPTGDRVLGTVGGYKLAQSASSLIAAQATLVETSGTGGDDSPPDFNLPAGLVLNGSSQYVSTPDNSLINPASGAFSVVLASTFADTASSALSKGNLGTADGYGFRRNGAGILQFFVDGATTSGGPQESIATWFDGSAHVAVGTSSGTAQVLYRDGTQVQTGAVTHGAVTNAVALVVGANNGGASGFMAMRAHAWAYYDRVLSATEALNASRYLLGYPGYRMPAGAVVFYDLRDQRTWRGFGSTLNDLSGNGLTASTAASPATRGIPWPLDELEAA